MAPISPIEMGLIHAKNCAKTVAENTIFFRAGNGQSGWKFSDQPALPVCTYPNIVHESRSHFMQMGVVRTLWLNTMESQPLHVSL